MQVEGLERRLRGEALQLPVGWHEVSLVATLSGVRGQVRANYCSFFLVCCHQVFPYISQRNCVRWQVLG